MRLVAVVLVLAACSVDEQVSRTGEGATVSGPPGIWFSADWSDGASPDALAAGTVGHLTYDLARLPACRASSEGLPAWVVNAYYSVDGGPATTMTAFGHQVPASATAVSFDFEIPFGHDLAFWFDNRDAHDCVAWDSDYGANYHFAIEQPSLPVIHFRRDWSVQVDGSLAPGGHALVDYDIARVPQCRGAGWKVVMHADEPTGHGDAPITYPWGNTTVPQAVQLSAAGGDRATVWFEASDQTGCQEWDSDFGQNFTIVF